MPRFPAQHELPRITVDSDMESDGDAGGQEMVLDESALMTSPTNTSSSTSRANGKTYQALEYDGGDDLEDPPSLKKPPTVPRERPPLAVQKQPSKPKQLSSKPLPKVVTHKNPRYSASAAKTKVMPRESPPENASSASNKKSKRMCLWLTVFVFLLIAVAVPVAVVLLKNKRSNASLSQGAADTDTSPTGSGTPDSNGGDGGDSAPVTDDGIPANGEPTPTVTDDNTDETATTTSPTLAPTKQSELLRVIQSVTSAELLADETTAQAKALNWLREYEGSYMYDSDQLRLQRYAVAVLGFAMYPSGVDIPLFGGPLESECNWRGVVCGDVSNETLVGEAFWTLQASNTTTSNSNSSVVTQVAWGEKELTGTIPAEIALLSSLEYLDLGDNALTGTLPVELFRLTNLQRLYLHKNQLRGTLSESFSQLTRLASFYGGNNMFSGAIPQGLGSVATGAANVRPLRYLSLNMNMLDGTIPSNMNLRVLYYMDLSFNNLTGSIPIDWMEGSDRLSKIHHLYLDHNLLSGPLPTSIPTLGNSRLEQLFLSDNRFYGTFPGGYTSNDFLQQLEIQNNDITMLDPNLCNQAVFMGGQLVHFKANCGICTCQYMCEECY